MPNKYERELGWAIGRISQNLYITAWGDLIQKNDAPILLR